MKSQRRKLVLKLDIVFSKFIRRRDADFLGYCNCYTCGKQFLPEEIEAGHYNGRACLRTRWDERNVHVQCTICNQSKSGNMPKYRLHLIEDYGPGIIEEFNKLKYLPEKIFTIEELKKMIKYYKQ